MNFLNKTFYGNTVLDYAVCLGIILASVVVAKIVYYVSKKVVKVATSRTKTKLDDIIVDKIEEPVIVAIILSASIFAFSTLNYSVSDLTAEDLEAGITIPYSHTKNFLDAMFNFLVVINVVWLIARLIDAIIIEYVTPLTKRTSTDLDNQVLPLIRKGVKLVIWILGIIVGLDNAGFDVGAVLAGLGIGGLAFALAAQDTVKNFFGGLMILIDKPFKIGERVRISGYDGTIKEIGIRSTRLQNLEGRIVTIPNSMFSDDAVENVDLEPTRKVVLNLGLVYGTKSEKVKEAIQILKDIVKDNSSLVEPNVDISFNNFGVYSLNILFMYYISKSSDILETQTTINLEIMMRFEKAGLEMAYPTQKVIQVN